MARDNLVPGLVLGVLAFAAFAFQTVGLEHTSATNSAFITELLVIVVPVLSAVLLRKLPERKIWAAAVIALVGTWLLTGAGMEIVRGAGLASGAGVNIGDVYSLFCAVAFALWIVYTTKYVSKDNVSILLVWQFLVVAGLSGIMMLAVGEIPGSLTLAGVGAVVYLAVVASVLADWLQTAAQRFVEPSKVGLILILEPAFALLYAVLWFGMALSLVKMAGAIVMLAAMALAEYDRIKI